MTAKPVLKIVDDNKTDAANGDIVATAPYVAHVTLRGSSDLLFHRWNCEAVDSKAKARKNSAAKKSDNVESYVWRNETGEICIPGEYLRQAIIHAAKFRQDPRSPRKSAMDLFKAGVMPITLLASVGKTEWDYLDTRRVTVQRAGINRTRPALRAGWQAEFDMQVLLAEYIDQTLLLELLSMAGRLVGIGDFRPTYGRFDVVGFET